MISDNLVINLMFISEKLAFFLILKKRVSGLSTRLSVFEVSSSSNETIFQRKKQTVISEAATAGVL